MFILEVELFSQIEQESDHLQIDVLQILEINFEIGLHTEVNSCQKTEDFLFYFRSELVKMELNLEKQIAVFH